MSVPDDLARVLGTVLDVAEVLPFDASTSSLFDRTDHVVFEWVGLENHLNEWQGKSGTLGANNTSADAAVRYRTSSGDIEIALIEWKYTEQYLGHELSGGDTNRTPSAAPGTRRCWPTKTHRFISTSSGSTISWSSPSTN